MAGVKADEGLRGLGAKIEPDNQIAAQPGEELSLFVILSTFHLGDDIHQDLTTQSDPAYAASMRFKYSV